MKLICWHLESGVKADEAFCHQADFVSAHITGARVSPALRMFSRDERGR